MLINLDKIVSKYGTPKGVIHMGAHLAEELEDYQRHNIKDDKNCTKLEELDEYLSSYGFDRVEIEMTDAQWGDALYIKK